MLSANYLEIIETIDYANSAPYFAFTPVYTFKWGKSPKTCAECEKMASVIGATYILPRTNRRLPVIAETWRDGVHWVAVDLMPSDDRTFTKWYRESECVAVVAPIALVTAKACKRERRAA